MRTWDEAQKCCTIVEKDSDLFYGSVDNFCNFDGDMPKRSELLLRNLSYYAMGCFALSVFAEDKDIRILLREVEKLVGLKANTFIKDDIFRYYFNPFVKDWKKETDKSISRFEEFFNKNSDGFAELAWCVSDLIANPYDIDVRGRDSVAYIENLTIGKVRKVIALFKRYLEKYETQLRFIMRYCKEKTENIKPFNSDKRRVRW